MSLEQVIADALAPRLIRTIPEGEPNAGAQEWEQPGAAEVADAVREYILAPVLSVVADLARAFAALPGDRDG